MGAAGYERFMQRYRSERTNEELMQLYHHIVDNWSAESRRFA